MRSAAQFAATITPGGCWITTPFGVARKAASMKAPIWLASGRVTLDAVVAMLLLETQ